MFLMKKIIFLILVTFVSLVSIACTESKSVNLSESTLANSIYIQNTPSGGAHKQYYFTEDTLKINAPQNIKPYFQEGDEYDDATSEEYFNIQVTEEKDSIIITGDDDFRLEFKKITDNLLEDMEGTRFIRNNK